MESINVKISRAPAMTVELKGVTISGSGSYSAGYADGKADAESADALEDAALLNEINNAIIAAALNPLSCAETLDDVPESVGKLYKQGYGHGEQEASSAAEAERKEVNAVLKGYGQPGADTLGDISAAVSNGIAVVNSQAYDVGHTYGKAEGMQAEYDRFWGAFQKNGTRDMCAYMFAGEGWTQETLKPKYPIKIRAGSTTSEGMFRSCCRGDGYNNPLDMSEVCAMIDFSQCTQSNNTFQDASLKNIYCDFSNCTTLSYTFSNGNGGGNESVTIKVSEKLTNANTAFNYCYSLKKFKFAEGSVLATTMNFQWSANLSRDSLESVIGALSDTATGKSVTFAKAAIVAAYGSTESGPWLVLCDTKPNWTISLV